MSDQSCKSLFDRTINEKVRSFYIPGAIRLSLQVEWNMEIPYLWINPFTWR